MHAFASMDTTLMPTGSLRRLTMSIQCFLSVLTFDYSLHLCSPSQFEEVEVFSSSGSSLGFVLYMLGLLTAS